MDDKITLRNRKNAKNKIDAKIIDFFNYVIFEIIKIK